LNEPAVISLPGSTQNVSRRLGRSGTGALSATSTVAGSTARIVSIPGNRDVRTPVFLYACQVVTTSSEVIGRPLENFTPGRSRRRQDVSELCVHDTASPGPTVRSLLGRVRGS
jgi:hypothetical protein